MPVEPTRLPVGSHAPDFTLSSPGHGDISLADYRGSKVLLVFLRGFG
jgi:peroxiredoxin